jgi:CBS domain-containing protein
MEVSAVRTGMAQKTVGTGWISALDPVRTIMSASVASIDAGASAREVAERLAHEEVGALIVENGTHLPGILSERDLVRAVARGADLDALSAGDLEAPETVWAETSDSIAAVAVVMHEADVRHIPLRSDGRLAGVVSVRDVLAVLLG